ncbi:extracellular solute-binding protein [Aureimonas fodinaquatilis]|uniref:Extracellular solute-binding protein n=1 Tax=Aureimonas fodinaquatilis TaxID=2565783 RepID=A0A5B0DZK3_9HYPH|nr:extracellular solute-binding protein [Aureimonas fodinaquatilis]KAA0971181.1 extracellular solute-binding protein [Aureimonas fodinaquatilis]
MMHISRRNFLTGTAGIALAGALPVSARSQQNIINILAHRVHQGVANGPAGSTTKDWEEETSSRLEWRTFDTGPLQERLFREAGLASTDIDMSYMLHTWANPTALNLFEPLNAHMERAPIENFEDFFPGMVDAMSSGGELWGIPMRHATAGLHYNEELFEERGLSGPPETMEELLEYARKLTYTRQDGTPVVGFVVPNNYSNIVNMARAWNGDFIGTDFQVRAADAPMVKALTELRGLFDAGAFPREFPSLLQEEASTWIQGGRAAMIITNMSRNAQFNDPERSSFPGRIKTTTVPISQELRSEFDVAPVGTEIWSYVIPRNAANKERSWDLIRAMSSVENTRIGALNGNGPARSSIYDDAEYSAKLEYSDEEARALAAARVPMPAFDGAPRASDLIRETYESVVLGFVEPEPALQDLAAQLQRLLPK